MTATTASTDLTTGELVAIGCVMIDAGVKLAGPLTADLITGGRSNSTYLLADGASKWVMRTPPRVGRTPSAHDVAREYRVTSALDPTRVPVAKTVALYEDEDLIGGAFAIAEFIAGRTIQSRDQLDQLDDTTVAAVSTRLIETLAELHRVDHVAVGLERFGRPDGYVERQLKRWAGQWELVGTPELQAPAADLVARLGASIPDQQHVGIVHGDYRIDNTILDLGGPEPRIAAVVDWELSTIGDPVADVAMTCAYRHPAFDLIVGSPSAWTSYRLPDAAGLVAGYEAAGGVPLESWSFHLALAYFKIGVIAAGIDYRKRSGGAFGPGFDTSGQSVPTYLELGRQTLADSR